MVFLKTILVILLIYYGLKILVPFLLFWLDFKKRNFDGRFIESLQNLKRMIRVKLGLGLPNGSTPNLPLLGPRLSHYPEHLVRSF